MLVEIEWNEIGYTYTFLTYIGVLERANVTILIAGSDGEQGTDTCTYYLGAV